MLKLSRAQYKQLCADCAAEMMRGAGHGGKIPDFSGTDMAFYVKDKALKGGGFTDTLSNTWKAPMTSIVDAGLTGPTYDAQGDWAWGTLCPLSPSRHS